MSQTLPVVYLLDSAEENDEQIRAQKDRAHHELKKLHEEDMAKFTYFKVNGVCDVRPDNLMVTLAAVPSAYNGTSVSSEIDSLITRDWTNIIYVEPQQMFEKEKLVILQGISGSGKSAFCHSLIHDWHAGRLWKDIYDFIFLLKVDELMTAKNEGPFTLEHALKVLYPDVFRHIKFNDLSKFRYLIIVDALDQCDVEKLCLAGKSPTVENSIKEVILAADNFDRLIMGTPGTCQKLQETLLTGIPVQHLEVLGFSEQQVMEYVLKFCEEDIYDAGALWQLIRENRSMLAFARLPLFSNIICNVLSERVSFTISTKTELYVWAYTVFQTRHLQKYRPFIDTNSPEKLFSYDILNGVMTRLGKIAYDNLSTGKTCFEPDQFFNTTEVESTLVTPFLVYRQQFLWLDHEIFAELFAAVYLFVNRTELDHETVNKPHLRGALQILCGLLGAASEDSKSPKIVRDFVHPLLQNFEIDCTAKHPLCTVSKALSETRKQLYLSLCFEFQNTRLLNDDELHWNNNAVLVANNHVILDHILFFLKHYRCEEKPIRRLIIRPVDRTISFTECIKLSDGIISNAKLNILHLCDIELNCEIMRILACALVSIPAVRFYAIRTARLECWEILNKFVQDAIKCKTLRLETVGLWACELSNEMMNKLSPIICSIPTFVFKLLLTTSVGCWEILHKVIKHALNNETLRLQTLSLCQCKLNKKMMSKLSPIICFIPTVWFNAIRTTSLKCWDILDKFVQDAHQSKTLRLEKLVAIGCDFPKGIAQKLRSIHVNVECI